MIHTFLNPSVECQVKSFLKLIISFLVQPLHHLFSLLIVTSSQIRVGMPLPLWSCCISGLGPEGLLYKHTIPVWSPGSLLRVILAYRKTSASKNLRRKTQWPKCCLYETPYITAPIREIGDVITRTLLYVRLSTDAPTRTRIFLITSNKFLKRPILLNWRLLSPFSTRKPHAKAVPRKDFCTHLRILKNARKGCWEIGPDYRTSHPRRFCAIGDNSPSKIWHPSGLTLRRMPYGRGTLRIPLRRIL